MLEVVFRVNGAIIPRIRFPQVTIHDVIGSQPNTAQLIFDGLQPNVGDAVAIGIGNFQPGSLLFTGIIQSLETTYDARPIATLSQWPATLIDQVFVINKRRPFMNYVGEPVSSLVTDLIGRFAPEFTTTHVQPAIPAAVTINFDGTKPLIECLAEVANQAGAQCKVDYSKDVHFFLPPEPGIPPPDPVDNFHPPLNEPPISFETDLSQVRTRVYGKGYGQTVLAPIATSETILPVDEAVLFNADGGRALAGTTPDGAQTQQLTYTGTQLPAGGAFVGPTITPTVSLGLDPRTGSGLGSGTYQYAYTFVTPSGETLPGPIGQVTLGPLALPAAPAVEAQMGTGMNPGDYTYAVTFVTTAGETTLGTLSSSVQLTAVPPPTTSPTLAFGSASGGYIPKPPGTTLWYAYTYANANGETTRGPAASGTTQAYYAAPTNSNSPFITAYGTSAPNVTYLRFYRSEDGTNFKFFQTSSNPGPGAAVTINDPYFTAGIAPPSVNGCGTLRVYLSNIPKGGGSVTARKLYRWSPSIAWGLVTTISDNTTTIYTDTNPTVGAAPPATNTALVNQVLVSGIAAGPSPTNARKLYRTVVNGSQLKLVTTFNDQTTTLYTDATPDGSIGANAPVTDTSGLVQTAGQVLPGATSILVSGTGPFFAGGGWARVNSQILRYTGISGMTLTGVPALGTGAITTSINYGDAITPVAALTGVAGLRSAMSHGASVHLFVQRDDLAAQSALGQLERHPDGTATDGIREYMLSDERRGEPSLRDICDADLATFSRPTVTVRYSTFDQKTRAGLSVYVGVTRGETWIAGPFNPAVFNTNVFNTLTHPAFGYAGEYIIQAVTITIDPAPTTYPRPRYAVEASSTKFTCMDLLQRVLVRP